MMHDQLPPAENRSIVDTEAEILAREVEGLLLSTDIKVIILAAQTATELPRINAVDGELTQLPLKDQILLRIRKAEVDKKLEIPLQNPPQTSIVIRS